MIAVEDSTSVEELLGLETSVEDPEKGKSTEKPVEEQKECASSQFGCCDGLDESVSAHGPRQEGCCLKSEFGCCPDYITPAQGISSI